MTSKFECRCARDIHTGQDSMFDAWLFSMMIDNNIAHSMNPQFIASPEQIRFMVAMGPDQVYLPCEDSVFQDIQEGDASGRLQKMYNRAWRIIVRLLRSSGADREDIRRRLIFCKYRFRQSIATTTLIPSRLVKRMMTLAFFMQGVSELWEGRRRESCARQIQMLESPMLAQVLGAVDRGELFGDMGAIHSRLNYLELARKMYLSIMSRPWLESLPSVIDVQKGFEAAARVSAPLELYFGNAASKLTVLFLVDADGGLVLDLALLDVLQRMGHRVILAVKEDFHFYAPTLTDVRTDPSLAELRRRACIVQSPAVSKNELLRLLREHKMLIISDGTQERMNLTRVSVTFARAWKEADLVIAKGWRNAGIFLRTSHQFTRDVLCYWVDDAGEYHVEARPRPATVCKFSERDIAAHADKIIAEMRAARDAGRTVMFYSCIIGSIPGQTSTAVKLVNAFVTHLRQQQDNMLIINPAEHFIEGMDGDDLMFMWERVQRSGYINIWRFQSVEDVEEGFRLLGRKVPPIWSGKDATYSTGCTKEMRIALDVQKANREMQLIGPDPRMFFRRSEYGIGKYFDATIN
ncbi:MAG: hypothetical protein PUB01_02965 [Desulfovibrionaceae bacterium]|nr:hypothetical protein [Desulfovibrionaceae bacterium]